MNNKKPITNLNELKEEIARVKIRVSEHEIALRQRWNIMPRKILYRSLGSVATFLVNKKLVGTAWDIFKIASSSILHKTPSLSVKKTLIRNAKSLGIFAVAKGAYNMIQSRFAAKPRKHETAQKDS